MKKTIFSLIMLLTCVFTYAQKPTVEDYKVFGNTTSTVESSKVLDNTYVSIYGGGMSWIDPAVSNSENFIKGVKPSVGIAVGKWFTPAVGAELFFDNSLGSLPFNKERDRYTAFDMMNLGLNGQLNLNNIIHTYKGKTDVVEVLVAGGFGWAHGWTTSPGSNIYPDHKGDGTTNFITANFGIPVNINLGKKQAWQINVRPTYHFIIAGEYLPVQFNAKKSYVGLQAGVTYKFGHKNSRGIKTHNFTTAYTEAEYMALRDKLKETRKPDMGHRSRPEVKIIEKKIETVKTINIIPDARFLKDKAIIDATSIAVLNDLAEEMKSNSDKYTITGYASIEGDEDHNQELSLARAEAIKQYLIDLGVDGSRLTTVGAGATEKFGDSLESNRRVTVIKN